MTQPLIAVFRTSRSDRSSAAILRQAILSLGDSFVRAGILFRLNMIC